MMLLGSQLKLGSSKSELRSPNSELGSSVRKLSKCSLLEVFTLIPSVSSVSCVSCDIWPDNLRTGSLGMISEQLQLRSWALFGGEEHLPLSLLTLPEYLPLPPNLMYIHALFLYPLTPPPPLLPQNLAAAPAINVSHGVCEIAKDYQKKKNALRGSCTHYV